MAGPYVEGAHDTTGPPCGGQSLAIGAESEKHIVPAIRSDQIRLQLDIHNLRTLKIEDANRPHLALKGDPAAVRTEFSTLSFRRDLALLHPCKGVKPLHRLAIVD
jgi:hypothetical protein